MHLQVGLSRSLTAMHLGFSKSTLSRTIKRDPEFRRVLAQVASLRGDNTLIELHAAEAATGLHAATPAERQQALTALSRLLHVAAA